ncbi:hypothetical protein J4Q44_G00318570 [Coregonus suidteri]|uniref:Uncharacterized protein n=1 Tax=Coregonus suidteri TaxID=861788 RepID=A0AAN8QA59_9TELE
MLSTREWEAPLCSASPPSAVPFSIFQDENDNKENCSAAMVDKAKPPRALAENPFYLNQRNKMNLRRKI